MSRLALTPVFLLVLPCAALAQGTSSQRNTTQPGASSSLTIRGRIFTPQGGPLEQQVRVTLKTMSQAVVQEIFSDSVGNFEFRGVPVNNYEIVVWATDRYETTTERIEIYARASRMVFQNIFLKEKEDRNANSKPKGSVISVGELSMKVPKVAEDHYRRGLKLVTQKKYEESIPHFLAAIETFPAFYRALNDLGVQYLRLRRFDEALDVLNRAIGIAPNVPHALVNVAEVKIERGEDAEAVPLLQRALELDASNWLVHTLLGVTYYHQGDYPHAKNEFDRALLMGEMPTVAVNYLYVANVYIRQRDYPKAIAECEKYLKDYPKGPDVPEVQSKVALMRATMDGDTIAITSRP